MNKNKKFSIRLTESQYDIIKTKAGDKSMSMFCRDYLLNEIHGGSKIADELLALRQELARIGNNINQIAKLINQGDKPDITGMSEIINDLRDKTNKRLARVR